MVRYVTLTYILAPVAIARLEQFENLVFLGDETTEVDASGVAARRADEPGNLMGAIFAQWHDTPDGEPSPAEDFLRQFSANPVEVRRKVIEDPHHSADGDCGSNFQGDHGDTHVYDGFLLIAPDEDVIEEFFCWADDIFA